MLFAEVLQAVAGRVEGCVGLMIVGMDGIPIEKLSLDEHYNFELLATELAALLRNTRQASEEFGAGRLQEWVVKTDALVLMAVAITEEYFLLGAMRAGGNAGRARFAMRRATHQLEKEFV
jgi:predicted regulator of Ras-like GTPase activity (Roadblock/LC7/MglB family)